MTVATGQREGFAGPRIALLATHAGRAGGAAIAMERLAAAVRAAGGQVDMVTRAAMPPVPAPARRLERLVRRGIRRARTPVSNTLFTADWPAWDLTDHPAVAAADLVNVHWVAGFIAAAGIRRLVESGRPVAWTLHDMRPFTGGCHYAGGCTGFTAACGPCPQLAAGLGRLPERSLARARRRLAGVPLVFVSPSRWLAGELVRSSLYDPSAHQVRVIPNGIDLTRYAPADRPAARRRLGLPDAGLAILLGSVSLEEHRKGARIAAEAVARGAAEIARRGVAPAPVAVTYGSGRVEIPGVVCRHLGSLDEAGVLDALHACDLHLTMAREDNLPNTVMEALACGLPVVATQAGGHPEMIADGVSGWLVGVDDAPAAAAVLVRLAEDPSLVQAAAHRGRALAEAEWDDRLQARRYLELAAEIRVSPPENRRRAAVSPAPGAAPAPLTPAAVVALHRGASLRGPLRQLRRLAARHGHLARRTMSMASRFHIVPTVGRSPPLDAADFSGPVFPEQAFPPRPEWAEAYVAACRRGYAAMAGTRVAITGLARDVGRVLPLTIQRIENLARLFADAQVVVFENDSQDDTRLLLRRWAGANRRVDVTCERLDDPVNPATRCLDRAGRMAFYRRRCQERVLELCPGFDHVIIIDFDVLGGFSLDGIASSFGSPRWDFVGSNGLICRRHGLAMNALRQYDTWAIRFDADLTPLSSAAAGGLIYERGGSLVPVTCCFGGLGIYTMAAYRRGVYGGDDLEHATFHRSLIAAGHDRLFLNPSQLVIYGRRHRFGDGLVAALGAGWTRLFGGGPRPGLFPRVRREAPSGSTGVRRAA